MEFQTSFHNHTNEELIESLKEFAIGQNHMASMEKEDITYWHYVAIADILLEAAKRLKNV